MSRYTFQGRRPAVSIVVGWDNPLRTFFARVWEGGGPGAGDLRLWAGGGRDRVPTVESLAELVAPYGDIPEGGAARLRDDPDRRLPGK